MDDINNVIAIHRLNNLPVWFKLITDMTNARKRGIIQQVEYNNK